jgi:glycosyltransferase involved in cell wall biosynthesis
LTGSSEPRVSVVLAFFDAGRFLAETVESVFAQTFDAWELVLADDGSTDSGREYARRLAEDHPDRVRYVDHLGHENRGTAATRNLGVAASRGELVAILDGDDVWNEDKLAQQVGLFDANPGADMVYGNSLYWRSWLSGSSETGRADWVPELKITADRLYGPRELAVLNYPLGRGASPCPSDIVVRKNVIEQVGGFEEDWKGELQLYEDIAFLTKVYLNASVYVSSDVFDKYRVHPNSCVSRVLRSGRYHEIRFFFLDEFLEPYLRENAIKDRRLWRALRRAQSRYRHPRIYALRQPGALREKVGRAARGEAIGHVRPRRLRRVRPVSERFGYDRGLPIDRYYIEKFLARHRLAIRGHVLEVGDDAYTRKFGGDRVEKVDVLNLEPEPGTTIVADLADAGHLPADTFDCVVLTQTLQYVHDPAAAVRTLHRILKPGGVLLATFPGLSRTAEVAWGDAWYWGFTSASARMLLEPVFGPENTKISTHGNVRATTAFMYGLAAEELDEGELDHFDPHYQLLLTVRAGKPAVPAVEPLVSVIVPCYNHGHFLGECLDSVFAQTYGNFEVVVVDDGSTDNSREVAQRYPAVRLVEQSHGGVSRAQNRGLSESRGELLVFLGADDRLLPNALADGVQAALSNPDAALVFGRFRIVTEAGLPVLTSEPTGEDRDPYVALLERNYIIDLGAAVLRRACLDDEPFDRAIRIGEDYDLFLRLAQEHPFFEHSALVHEVRKHGRNTTQDHAAALTSTLAVLRRQWPNVRRTQHLRTAYERGVQFWRDWYGSRLYTRARVAMAQGRRRDALRDALILLRSDPSAVRRLVKRERVSNRLLFTIGDPGHSASPNSWGGHRDLRLVKLGIEGTEPGVGFNVQPDGRSALWIECENATEETVVVWDDVPLRTAFGGPRLLTASVPAELYASPRIAEIYLLH